MWLNKGQIIDSAIYRYRESLLGSCPNYLIIDNLFEALKLDEVMGALHLDSHWQVQRHTYSQLYVDSVHWQNTANEERFVQRDVWLREGPSTNVTVSHLCQAKCPAQAFLSYLRGAEFMSLLSRIFNVPLTDTNLAEPEINSNYFRLGPGDFVELHADNSPGRKVCMLLYLNKKWNPTAGGELSFAGNHDVPVRIAPVYNRCVLFDPSSAGSEHWVETLNTDTNKYRYNVTSWYWSE